MKMKRKTDYEQYRAQWDSAYITTPEIPLNIDIELSSVCNLKCPFCYLSNPGYSHPSNKFMPSIYISKIMQQVKDLKIPAVKLNWRGEPTLHPSFNEIVAYIADSVDLMDIIINTNGNYTSDKLEGLMHTTKVIFSIDSLINKTYKKMRVGGSLKKVINNIKSLMKSGHSCIIARRVITNANKREDFRADCKRIFGEIQVSEHMAFDRGIKGHQVDSHKDLKRVYCGYPSQRLVIDTDGNIMPCCVDVEKIISLGNINKLSLLEAWQCKCMKRIRSFLKKGYAFEYIPCKGCTSWMSYDSKYREYVKK